MNETDYLRAQLALERAHLQAILQAVRHGSPALRNARPIADYIDWAGRRLVGQLDAQRQALLAATVSSADGRAPLERLSGAAAAVSDGAAASPADLKAERLLALLAAWSDPLEALAGSTLRVTQWRQAAQLSADTILQERRLYTAACAAAGLS
jgi:hypothetical protein